MNVEEPLDPQKRYSLTLSYARSILHPTRVVVEPGQVEPPVTARSRTDLLECLDYFRQLRGNIYNRSGHVLGYLLGDEPGERSYMDSEVVITKAGSVERITDPAVEYLNRTRTNGTSVVLITNNRYPDLPVKMGNMIQGGEGAGFSVLGQFRLVYWWAEKSGGGGGGKIFFKIMFHKIRLGDRSWWTPRQPPTPEERGWTRDFRLGWPEGRTGEVGLECFFCRVCSPRIYVQGWTCLNCRCERGFWQMHDDHGRKVDLQDTPLKIDEAFLMRRSEGPFARVYQPMFDLRGDLLDQVNGLEGTGLAVTNIRALWRGYCCRRCGLCTPRTFWHKWHCERCRDEFPFLLGPIPLQSIVDRTFPSFDGHPVINHAWPPDIPYEGPTFRQEYRVDRWRLHAGAELTLLTPTRARNAAQGGADEIWTRLVDDMNRGTVEMRRVRMKGSLLKGWSGGLCRHFFANFGAEYDWSGFPTVPFDRAPYSVLQALNHVNFVGKQELGDRYVEPNELQSLGYWEEMELPWHFDGGDELGDTITTLSLGCDATMSVRLKKQYYENEGVFGPQGEVVLGARNWRKVLAMKQSRLAGGGELDNSSHVSFEVEDDDEPRPGHERVVSNQHGTYKRHPARPEMSLQLIHGSVVIMHGRSLQQYYEHRVQVHGKVRIAVTTRQVDEKKREENYSSAGKKRACGQRFIFEGKSKRRWQNHGNGDDDDDDEEDDGDQEAMAQPVRRGPGRPRKDGRPPGSVPSQRKRKRGQSPSGGTGEADGRDDAPPDKAPRRPWSKEENDRLIRMREFYSTVWNGFAQRHGFDRTDDACKRQYSVLIRGARLRSEEESQLPQPSGGTYEFRPPTPEPVIRPRQRATGLRRSLRLVEKGKG